MPVIAMTAHAMVGDRERFLESGMNDYISKPVDAGELARLVEKWARRETPEPAPSGIAGKEAGTPEMDPRELLGRIDNDRQLFDELIAMFLDDTETRLATIKTAIERDDREALRRTAHAIKGAAANLGARRVFSTAARLETASTNPGNGVHNLYAELVGDYARVKSQLVGAKP